MIQGEDSNSLRENKKIQKFRLGDWIPKKSTAYNNIIDKSENHSSLYYAITLKT